MEEIIRQLVMLLNDIDAHKNPIEMFRKGGIGGQDQYAGMSSFQRRYRILMNKYHEEINNIFKRK